MNKSIVTLVVILLSLSGCEEKQETPTAVVQASDTNSSKSVNTLYGMSDPQAATNIPALSAADSNHVGTVLETMDATGYTYARVNENGNEYWIAGPRSAIKVGESISYIEQMIMSDFKSKTLERTFDSVMFTSAIVSTNKASQAAKTMDVNAHKSGHAASNSASELKLVKVEKIKGGYSVAELYQEKSTLKDTSVSLKAQVVKISRNIMGKDWVHLQDGSGSEGSNDLLATTKGASVNVGDIVSVKGVVKTDVNLGYGYFFALMLEDSSFTN